MSTRSKELQVMLATHMREQRAKQQNKQLKATHNEKLMQIADIMNNTALRMKVLVKVNRNRAGDLNLVIHNQNRKGGDLENLTLSPKAWIRIAFEYSHVAANAIARSFGVSKALQDTFPSQWLIPVALCEVRNLGVLFKFGHGIRCGERARPEALPLCAHNRLPQT